MDVIARNTSVSSAFTRFDLHVDGGATSTAPCHVWGMVIPGQ